MKAKFFRALVSLYPPYWQGRYGDEFLAVVEQCSLAPGVAWDILLGAIDAYIHSVGINDIAWRLMNAIRNRLLVVFCAYGAFLVAGMALVGMVDDSPFAPLMKGSLFMHSAWEALAACAGLSFIVMFVGTLPIIWQVLGSTFRQRRQNLGLLAVPVIAFGIVGIYLLGFTLVSSHLLPITIPGPQPVPGQQAPAIYLTLSAIGGGLLVLAIVVSVAAVCLLILRADISDLELRLGGQKLTLKPYRLALLPSALAALLMVAMFICTVTWGVVAQTLSPGIFASEGGLWGLSTPEVWWAVVGVMTVATVLAATSAVGAVKTSRQLVGSVGAGG